MTATTTTTIQGVSILSRQRRRKADVFDIALSPGGIAILRPGRAEQRMTWERVTQWEIEERPGCVVLTLRGSGSVTPLVVKGWTLDDLETVMRQATADTAPPATSTVESPAVEVAVAEVAVAEVAVAEVAPPVLPRAARRQAAQAARRRGAWKPFVAVVLLALLATAVTLVLLQSAGLISWGFLGPTA